MVKRNREKAKNVVKNTGRVTKRIIRTVDDVFAQHPDLVSLTGMQNAATMVSKVRNVVAPKVSPCLKKWYTCLTTPFHQNAMGACIPSGDVHSSMRRFGFVRFDLVVGSDGVAFVAVSPNLANDAPQCYISNGYYDRGDVKILGSNNQYCLAGASVATESITMPNLPFTVSQLTTPNSTDTQVQGRIVGGGLRIQYTGKTTDQAGLLYTYTDPQHITACNSIEGGILGNVTPAYLGSFQETIIKPVSREPMEISLAPLIASELEYHTPLFRNAAETSKLVYPWGEGLRMNGFTVNCLTSLGVTKGIDFTCPTTVLVISGATAGSTFHVEMGLHCEYVGRLSEGQRLPADSDPVGVTNMMAAISRAVLTEGAAKDSNFSSRLKKSYAEVVAGSSYSSRL